MGQDFFLSRTFLGMQILTQYYQSMGYAPLGWWAGKGVSHTHEGESWQRKELE